jgi:molybdopterin synthase catalytic subunit
MRTFGIVGPGAGDLCARVVPRLDGRVATFDATEPLDGDGRDPAADTGRAGDAYRVGPDGSWAARGTDRSLDALLDDAAPRYDHAVCLGAGPGLGLPTVVLGGREVDPDATVLAEAPAAGAVDVDALLDALADVEPRVTLGTLVARVKQSPRADRAGAIATFTGRVRAKDAEDDARTTALEFEKYEGVADERMATIARELTDRDGVFDVRMHHRTGVVPDGEDIVFVVVLAGHREEAFRTVEDGINRLKDEVPLFKKEVTVEETFWRHER